MQRGYRRGTRRVLGGCREDDGDIEGCKKGAGRMLGSPGPQHIPMTHTAEETCLNTARPLPRSHGGAGTPWMWVQPHSDAGAAAPRASGAGWAGGERGQWLPGAAEVPGRWASQWLNRPRGGTVHTPAVSLSLQHPGTPRHGGGGPSRAHSPAARGAGGRGGVPARRPGAPPRWHPPRRGRPRPGRAGAAGCPSSPARLEAARQSGAAAGLGDAQGEVLGGKGEPDAWVPPWLSAGSRI